jgi:hypothetical protein
MNDREVLQTALDKCELYLGNTRIEKANMKKFEQLMLDNFFSDNRLVYISIIPDDKFLSYIFLIAGMVAYISNSQSIDDYIYELIEATKENSNFRVTYGGRIYKINPKFSKKNELCLVNYKNKLTTRVQRKHWNQVLDYAGNAKDRVKHYQTLKDRVNFYKKVFGNMSKTKSVVFGDISYIVVNRKRANRILDKLYIEIPGMERKKFSEIFTVGYQNGDADEILKYSGNLGEAYPAIGVCNDLVTIKNWTEEFKDYPVAMLYVADWQTIQRDRGFIHQIFNNKTISLQMYNFFFRFGLMKDIRHLQEADAYWGTTPTYLEQNPDLAASITASTSGTITTNCFHSSITREEYQDIIRKIRILRKQKEDSPKGFEFMCYAVGLIRRLRTDCSCIGDAFINPYIDSIRHLKEIKGNIYDSAIKNLCSDICVFVERLYEDIVQNQYKHKKLKEILNDNPHGNKLLVVPYYHQCNSISFSGKGKYHLDIATPLKMKERKNYDLIIVSGTFFLRDVPIFLHLHAKRTIFFLYGFEKPDYTKLADYAHKQLHEFEVLAGTVTGNVMPVLEAASEAVWDEKLDYTDISEIIHRFHPASTGSDIVQERKIEVVRLGLLDDGRQYLFSKKKVNYLNSEENKVQLIEVDKLIPGMSFLYCRDFGNRHDIINVILKEEKKNSDDFQQSVALMGQWKSCLVRYMKDHSSSWNDLSRQIGIMGYPNSGGAIIRSWIAPESHVIGPRDKKAYQAIKKIIAPYDGDTTAEAYQKATETVRNIHNIITKKITKILPRVYEDTQRGIQADTLVKKMLQDDLDEFVEVLNLSDIQRLKQSAMIPGNYVNIPLESEELMNFE